MTKCYDDPRPSVCRVCGEEGPKCVCVRTGRRSKPAHTALDEVASITRAIRSRLFELEHYIIHTDHQIEGRAATIILDKSNNLRWLVDNIERITMENNDD